MRKLFLRFTLAVTSIWGGQLAHTAPQCSGCNPVCWSDGVVIALAPWGGTMNVWEASSPGCYELVRWIRWFDLVEYPICESGVYAGTILVAHLQYIEKKYTGVEYCVNQGWTIGDGPVTPGVPPEDQVPAANPPPGPSSPPPTYGPVSGSGWCFSDALLEPTMPPYPAPPPGTNPPGSPATPVSPGETGGYPDTPSVEKMLSNPCWVEVPMPVLYPPPMPLPTIPAGGVALMKYVPDPLNPNVPPLAGDKPHIARSNGDDTFSNKDDKEPLDPDASLGECFDDYAAATPDGYLPVLVIYIFVCD